MYKNKINKLLSLTVICGGFFLLNSCSNLNWNDKFQVRKIASSSPSEMYLTSGLYPNSLVTKNIFDSEGRAKIVFNLPPYTNPGGIGIIPEMIKTIDEAKSSIRMSVFQFNHAGTFESLKRAVSRGVKVFIATDLCYSSKAGYKEYFDDLRTFMSANGQDGNTQVIDDKTPSCDTMFNHNKYMIVDYELDQNVKAWFGSFNPTNHGSVENVELAIVAKDKRAAEILKLDFDQQISGKFKVNKKGVYSVILKDGSESLQTLNDLEIQEAKNQNKKVTYPKFSIGDAEFEFILSPKVKSLTRIVEEVYASKNEILFSSYAIADQMLISSLINKSKSTEVNTNLFSVLSLPHPYDNEGYVLVKNGESGNVSQIYSKSNTSKNPSPEVLKTLQPIVDEIKSTLATPVNYLTPKNELKSTFHYIYPRGDAGGVINKVFVEGIFNNKVIDEENTLQRMAKYNIPVYRSSLTGELHNKLFLIDEEKVIFGSHNFSQSAENSNDELTVIIKSPKLTKLLKNELYAKTKLFAVKDSKPTESFSGDSSLVISEIMSESSFKMNLNKKVIDIGDYVEIYNYGSKGINLLGYRFDDHYFPDHDGEKLETSTFLGALGTLVRFIPNKSMNQLGTLDYNPSNNILMPGKVALIVGKYFNESFYKDRFILNFKNKYGTIPTEADFPILFSTGEYFSNVIGDGTTGVTSKDRLTLFGMDAMTVIDRFNSPRLISKNGVSLERNLDLENLKSQYNGRAFNFEIKKFTLKNGVEITDEVFLPNYTFSTKTDWEESSEIGGTPGIVNFSKRTISSAANYYSVLGEYADVETNTFKKALIVIKDNKILEITNPDNTNYPKPIMTDVLIYPGLIDTHNHIKYNTMPIWKVSKVYDNRNQWPEDSVYKNAIKEMYKNIYMEWGECTQADELERNKCLALNRCKILKYAEMKALIGGTTSIQGSSSFDENSSDITFKGLTGYTAGSGNKMTKSKARIAEDLLDECSSDLARNVEREKWFGKDEVRTTAQSIFSDAFARSSISDPVKYKQTPSGKLNNEFQNKITNTLFIHLGEGSDQSSKSEFAELDYLKLVAPQTTVIHGTAFDETEFKSMGERGLSLAWSPTSNLLLYKKTTNVVAALKNKVNVAIGSDWSLSGTKSLLYELKVANMVNQKYFKNAISNNDLLKMVTINGARASHLDSLIGSISKNKLADFFIVKSNQKIGTPFDTLLKLNEENIQGVFVGGNPVVGNFDFLNNTIHATNGQSDLTKVSDSSCAKNMAFVMNHDSYDSIVNVLANKTKNAFNALSIKLQMSLGAEFQNLDPLCSDNDSRMLGILKSL